MAGAPIRRMHAQRIALENARKLRGVAHVSDEARDLPVFNEVQAHRIADAIIDHDGDPRQTLIALGEEKAKFYNNRTLVKRISRLIATERVRELVALRLSDLERQKKYLIERQVKIARWGADNDSTRAFQGLARMAGWNASIKIEGKVDVLNIHAIMQNPALIDEALQHFGHEPGEAIAIPEALEKHDGPTYEHE